MDDDTQIDEEISSELVRLSTRPSPDSTDSQSTEVTTVSTTSSAFFPHGPTGAGMSPEYAYLEPWLAAAPVLPLEDQAVAMYFSQIFCPNQTDRAAGWPVHLAGMYYAAGPESAVRLSTSSAALAAISKRPETRHLAPFAAKVYGRAMKAVQRAVNDPLQRTTDETLQSVLSLAFYEANIPIHRRIQRPPVWPTTNRVADLESDEP